MKTNSVKKAIWAVVCSISLLGNTSFAHEDSITTINPHEAYAVFDIRSGQQIFSQNQDKVISTPSGVSLLTVMVFLTEVNKGTIEKEQKIPVVRSESSNTQTFRLGTTEKISIDNLIKAVLLLSSEDAASSLKAHIGGENEFAFLVNKLLSDLNLSSCLNEEEKLSCSVSDYGTLLLRVIQQIKEYGIPLDVQFMEIDGLKYPNPLKISRGSDSFILSKALSKDVLAVIAQTGSDPLKSGTREAFIVYSEDIGNDESTITKTSKILAQAIHDTETIPLFSPGQTVETVTVKNKKLTLSVPKTVFITINKKDIAATSNPKLRIHVNVPTDSEINESKTVGIISIEFDDKTIGTSPAVVLDEPNLEKDAMSSDELKQLKDDSKALEDKPSNKIQKSSNVE